MTFRVGLTGAATVGKDVAADALVGRLGFVKVNMSHALMRDIEILDPPIIVDKIDGGYICRSLSDLLSEMSYDELKARYPHFREMLQTYGTEVHRAIDEDYWVNRAIDAIAAGGFERVVTTGIRFPNEMTGLDILVHIDRPGVGPVNAHISDAGMHEVISYADYTIENNGTMEELGDAIVELVGPLVEASEKTDPTPSLLKLRQAINAAKSADRRAFRSELFGS